MKGLSIEQKAKAYDKALGKAEDALNDGTISNNTIAYLQDIFPELKESEEECVEKIKKEIILYLNNRQITSIAESSATEKWIAWLEEHQAYEAKDGEIITYSETDGYKVVEPKFKVGDTMRTLQEASNGITDGVPVVVSIDNEYYHCNNEIIAIKDQNNYEYPPINKKPADKVEPFDKYEGLTDFERTLADICIGWIGEELGWKQYIKDNADILLKIAIEKFNSVQDAPFEQKPADKVNSKFHEGDWIVHHGTENIYQVVAVIDNQYQLKYGDNYTIQNCADVDRCARLWNISDAKDGDVLVASDNSLFIFAKVKNNSAYYYFSLCTNGSKEISDGTHAWETANGCHPATKEQRGLLFQKMKEAGYEWDAEKKMLEKTEDKKPLLSDFFNAEYERGKEDAIKDMKSAWGEEDERNMQNIDSVLFYDKTLPEDTCVKLRNFLKSLKDRYTWKPSEEQLLCLHDAIEHYQTNGYPASTLNELYEQMSNIYKL